ncbi:MAG TPA: sigma-70 family RNA polymerase sigma factor [Acidimicrobiales bacterium]|nr:sigma-70 family RNA polymerase sigma factor [Acidimicrobiales bacterium]
MTENDYPGFDTWYSDNHKRVLHAVTVVSGNPDAASEATDEAFVRALARWKRVSTMKSPTGWTCRVALNQLRRRYRRQQRENVLLSRANYIAGSEQDLSLWLQVLEAVEPLTVRQRTVLALTYVADLPQEEVAKMMHVSRSTVASTLADARSAVLAHDSGRVIWAEGST